MVTDNEEKVEVERDISTLESRFQNFHHYRGVEDGQWNLLVKRELPQAIPSHLAMIQDGIDYQSPDPAKAIHDHKAVMLMNPVQMDYRVGGTGTRSRELERDHLLTKATWFNQDINPRDTWRARVAEGQIRHGIKVEWLRAKRCGKD